MTKRVIGDEIAKGGGLFTKRRTILQAGFALAAAGLPGCPKPQPPTPPVAEYTGRVVTVDGKKVHVRRRLSAWTAQDYASYRKAVQAMQARPVTDPTSWLFQANIHGAPPADGANDAWRKCPHGTADFLTWHRMYLYFWERIVRKAAEDPDFSIGYWRYESDDPASLALPEGFRTPTAGNPLYVANRSAAMNGGSTMPPSAVLAATALAESTLLPPPIPGFADAIESSPHDNVHVQVSGLMGSVPTAARDPIFWTHHANIDRYWSRWLDTAGHSNPTSGSFLTTVFQFFDENGAPVTMTGADVLRTLDQLSYKYDDDPVSRAPSSPPSVSSAVVTTPPPPHLLAAAPAPRFELGGDSRSYSIDLPPAAATEVRRSLAPSTPQRILLNLEDPAVSGVPDASYEVYVNLPAGAQNVDYKSPHFAGTISFFGVEPGHAHGRKITLNLAGALAKLERAGALDLARIQVTFVAVQAGVKPGAPVRTQITSSFGRLSLSAE
jgi:tyrosinase